MIPESDVSPATSGLAVLVIQPDPSCPLDRLGPWLRGEGLTTRIVQPFNNDPIPEVMEEDALVVLGGDMSSLDDHAYSWLADIRHLMTDAARRRKPALGICLGAQLMAQAFGGRVTRGDQGLEAGVVSVSLSPQAEQDSLLAGLPDPFLVGAMHGDMIAQLPPSAVWLASTAQYPNQAFRVGDVSWGVQFHPELSKAGYRRWLSLVNENDLVAVERAGRGMTDFETKDEVVAIHTETLARRFATLVRTTAAMIAS